MAYTTIKKPSSYFNTKLYTGNGSTNAITGVGFQPDFTWIKDRSAANSHRLFDVVRGATEKLYSNLTNAESTDVNSLTAWTTDGFNIGTDGGSNTNSNNYASWNWLASNTTTSNTDGSITSTVSANTTSGFSIVSYTGTGSNATVGHGLGAEPKCIIFKDRNTASDWRMYHVGVGNTGALTLNNTNATQTNSVFFQNTTPTSTVFSLGTGTDVNNTNPFIAYCFAEKQGFSKFGSYNGNASADGTFVYTGFKPKFLMVKRYSSSGDDWYIFDSARDTDNTVDKFLYPNVNASEGTTSPTLDFLSNGFKWRKTSAFSPVNQSGATYIYMAFAEEPLVGDNPATAR